MSEQTELMLKYADGELEKNEAYSIEKMLKENKDLRKRFLLNHRIDEYMRVRQLLDEVQSDPDFSEIQALTKTAINEHILDDKKQDENIIFFINGALSSNKKLEMQVADAEHEMYVSGIESQTYDWVKSWEEQKQNGSNQDKYTLEITDFVRSGMRTEFHEEKQIPVIKNTIYKKLLMQISAAAAIIIFALGIWSIIGPKNTPGELYAAYYQPYNVIDGQTRSLEQEVNSKFKEGVKLYKSGNYSQAALIFKDLLNIDNGASKIKLLYGISQMEQENYNLAIFSFKEIIAANGDYLIESKWYLAMCYLRLDDINSAKVILKELSKIPGIYKSKSLDLLEEL